MLNLDIDVLSKARTFVGLYKNICIHVGTKDSGYRNVNISGADADASTIRVGREISSTVGTSGLGIFTAAIGVKIILSKGLFAPVEAENTRLDDRLLNSRDSPLLLYDVEKRQGSIIPELNAILEIAHVWAARQADKDRLLPKMPFAQASYNRGQAAYDAITENRELILQPKYAEEKDLYCMSLIKDFFRALEKRRDQRKLINDSSLPLPRLPCIRG
jgi:hypothetical protein